VTHIDSPKNARIVAVARLHRRNHRRRSGRTIIEGPHVITTALDRRLPIEEIFTVAGDGPAEVAMRATGTTVTTVSEDVLTRLAGTKHPRGPIAVIEIPEPDPILPTDSIVLVGVADPGNAGTIIRTAAALGFQVIMAGEGVDVWSPKVLRAAAGGHFLTRICQTAADPVPALASAGIETAAFVVARGSAIADIGRAPAALLIGSEPHGLPDHLIATCDHRVTLPMPGGAESLNASVAAAIAMWERRRLMA
jgi:TrmH family RNA methyltransferase